MSWKQQDRPVVVQYPETNGGKAAFPKKGAELYAEIAIRLYEFNWRNG